MKLKNSYRTYREQWDDTDKFTRATQISNSALVQYLITFGSRCPQCSGLALSCDRIVLDGLKAEGSEAEAKLLSEFLCSCTAAASLRAKLMPLKDQKPNYSTKPTEGLEIIAKGIEERFPKS